MADDRHIAERVQRLGGQGAERRHREAQNLAIEGAARHRRDSTMRPMAHRAALLAVLLVGCGTTDEPLPVACQGDTAAYAHALRAAPEVVRLDGTALAECIRRARTDAELVALGSTLTTLGEQLEQRAIGGDTDAALQLGYLTGAAERAARDTEGIHAELAYRIERSAAAVTDGTPDLQRALRRGIAAGSARG